MNRYSSPSGGRKREWPPPVALLHVTALAHHLTIVEGGNALSPSRAAALRAQIRQVAPAVTDVSARYVHVVSANASLDEATTATVRRLLDYGDAYRVP